MPLFGAADTAKGILLRDVVRLDSHAQLMGAHRLLCDLLCLGDLCCQNAWNLMSECVANEAALFQ